MNRIRLVLQQIAQHLITHIVASKQLHAWDYRYIHTFERNIYGLFKDTESFGDRKYGKILERANALIMLRVCVKSATNAIIQHSMNTRVNSCTLYDAAAVYTRIFKKAYTLQNLKSKVISRLSVNMTEPLAKRKRSESFKLEIPGDSFVKQVLMGKIHKVRDILVKKLDSKVNHADILNAALDYWLNHHDLKHARTQQNISTYVPVHADRSNQPFYVCAEDSLKKLVEICDSHGQHCSNELQVQKVQYSGHVGILRLACKQNTHNLMWSSSPYSTNQKHLVNLRIQHSLACSGMLPSHYMRFVREAGIGYIGKKARSQFDRVHQTAITAEYHDSTDTATHIEIGMNDFEDACTFSGVAIITDARHGWRKNAKDSSISTIGMLSHKIMHHQHVTKADHPVTQNHERLGTELVYEHFAANGIPIAIHAHDRNMSINKYVREQQPNTINQNDRWHAIKAVKKRMTEVASGPAYKRGVTWDPELDDKIEAVGNHFYWAVDNCQGDCIVLKSYLNNIQDHYRNHHERCHPTSRCRRDPNYEPKRKVLSSASAIKLLDSVVKSSVIYKHPEDFALGKDTGIVESFHNVMNIFHDKRIALGDASYLARSHLAVCHWNENSGRDYTSVWTKAGSGTSRRTRSKKVYKDCTFQYSKNIWQRYLLSVNV